MEKRETIEALLMEHFERRPQMRATDAYKLIFQGVFGVGHILGEGARKRLEEEVESLDIEDHPTEPLIERVSVDGSMIRVNLRPYLRRGFPLDRLYEAMEKTSKDRGSPEQFLFVWSVFHELANSGAIEVDGEELDSMHRQLQRENPRPHHHSELYRGAYFPAYRVVKREHFERLISFQ